MIGKLERVPLREVWKHEALDFTTWLEENIDVLNELLDFELSSVEREKSAGAFNVDLVAEDGNGNLMISGDVGTQVVCCQQVQEIRACHNTLTSKPAAMASR